MRFVLRFAEAMSQLPEGENVRPLLDDISTFFRRRRVSVSPGSVALHERGNAEFSERSSKTQQETLVRHEARIE